MFIFALLGSLSVADASPTKGVRIGVCAGASVNCPLAQVRLSYNHDQVGFTLGAGLLSLSAAGQYYLSPVDSKTRQFVSASWTPIAFPGAAVGFDGSLFLGIMSGYGLSYGADIHLTEKRWLVISPKIGLNIIETAEGDGSNSRTLVHPSLSTDLSLAF